jgi:hypothetical protein
MRTPLPKYVLLGSSCLRHRPEHKDYYRDCGAWAVGYRRDKEGRLISWFPGKFAPWLHKVPLIEVTESEWDKDNYGRRDGV